ncbi:hypothetical protein T459_22826 [Capsicum annuum]|uniref:Uncharacterized protein n=1 Tax=Capsicum annuum TaxID=4072 RepID=A0A2G2YQZ3_CAPAN|nr:hypothetical protein T459_22826 [Capsicum annuum]
MTIEGDGDKEYPDEDEVTSNRLVQERENVSQDCEFKVETVNGDVRVIEAANGLQAWKILENGTNQIDVVLSEVSSGSGSGTQTRKSVKSKSSEQSANDIGSYDGEDNQRNAPLGKGSDDGSDIECRPCNQAPEPGGSTCVQVIRSNAENSTHMESHMTRTPQEIAKKNLAKTMALKKANSLSLVRLEIQS